MLRGKWLRGIGVKDIRDGKGILAVFKEKGGVSGGIMHVIVVCKFESWKEATPVLLGIGYNARLQSFWV